MYGMILNLFGKCFWLLFDLKATQKNIYSKGMQRFLFSYLIYMLLMATLALVSELYCIGTGLFLVDALNHGPTDMLRILYSGGAPSLPFTIWGADGFLVWRCFILYSGVSRVAWIALVGVLSLLSITSLGVGIVFLLPNQLEGLWNGHKSSDWQVLSQLFQTTTLLGISTLIINLGLAGLIVGRIIYHQRFILKTLGDGHERPYTRVITMCIESSSLILVVTAVYTFSTCGLLAGTNNDPLGGTNRLISNYSLVLFPHICVISPLLIIFQVAQGRAATIMDPSEIEIRMESIRFGNSQVLRANEN
ncbi:hypothetical protein GALMADRAFT_280234 [Galerina marginata CBS 339.88]|uniref:G-protein coupled receptors family 1 profile domain-containing protein n=1 Tax=Galerina marginata (strain CBS 339.88) TaxID=685588 RepID=A0A067T4X5_GALM3|nr:hypothetical protein GALMADRAFT_280234 [Galerina marginata CBS 339.88]